MDTSSLINCHSASFLVWRNVVAPLEADVFVFYDSRWKTSSGRNSGFGAEEAEAGSRHQPGPGPERNPAGDHEDDETGEEALA